MNATQFSAIGIIGKYGADHSEANINRVIALLETRGIAYTLDSNTMPDTLKDHPHSCPMKQWQDALDLAIVVGGDGTFLYAARALQSKHIPLIGINAGRLGFLADLSAAELESQLSAVLDGHYCRESRQLLAVEIRTGETIRAQFVAVNEVVIHKRTMARMVELNAYAGGQFLCHYYADGLILSTPTGSTAYALSAGGPILEPNLNAMIVAPICPHTLTHRPVVLSGDREIEVLPGKDSHNIQLTIDGQEEFLLTAQDRIITRHGGHIHVLHPADYQFQRRLRQKFNWGMNPENNHNHR